MSFNSNLLNFPFKESTLHLSTEISELIQELTNESMSESSNQLVHDLRQLSLHLNHLHSLKSFTFLLLSTIEYLVHSTFETYHKLLCNKAKLFLSNFQQFQRLLQETIQDLPPIKFQMPSSLEEVEKDIAATPAWIQALLLSKQVAKRNERRGK